MAVGMERSGNSGTPQAVVFDMDGVLVDSEPMHHEAVRVALAPEGVQVRDEDLLPYRGQRHEAAFTALKERFGLSLGVEEYLHRVGEALLERFAAGVQARPGVHAVLSRLREGGYRLAVATSTPRRWAQPLLERIGVLPWLDSVVTGEEVVHGKPAPDIFLLAAQRLGVVPAACVVVEDAVAGVRAARAAGMRVIALATPEVPPQALGEADRIIEDFGAFPWELFPPRRS